MRDYATAEEPDMPDEAMAQRERALAMGAEPPDLAEHGEAISSGGEPGAEDDADQVLALAREVAARQRPRVEALSRRLEEKHGEAAAEPRHEDDGMADDHDDQDGARSGGR
jgi:hypothetical protein